MYIFISLRMREVLKQLAFARLLGRQAGQHRIGLKVECHADFLLVPIIPCLHSGKAMPIVPSPSVETTVHWYPHDHKHS